MRDPLGVRVERHTREAGENAGPTARAEYTVSVHVAWSCPRCNTACAANDYLCFFCGWVKSNGHGWVCICNAMNPDSAHACRVCDSIRSKHGSES